ncbi:MAG: YjbQ family protein [Candidatus Atribacteria bacterium]|nr:YjbQ family protein [Candidatus Atribacteria bacterium]
MFTEIQLQTKKQEEFLSITRMIREIVKNSRIKDGIAIIQIPHTTAGITINESADPDVVSDISRMLNIMVPDRFDYFHQEGNSPAHIKASLMGSSALVIIKEGDLMLGTWQGIFFCEFDGPRSRKIWVKII